MTTLTFPLSRIEGHARVVVEIQDGRPVAANFQATEFRGFDFLVQNVPAEQMPVIVPRICGVCSTAHHVAAVKALEDVYGVQPPPLALKIRELLMLGQLIQNQATSLFIFTLPDRLGTTSIFETENTDDTQLSSLTARVLQVRQAGTHLITLAGGQFIHPVKAVVGGVTSGVAPEAAETMRQELEVVLPQSCALFDYYWELSLSLRERIGTWGDDGPASYITAISDCTPNYYGEQITITSAEGALEAAFDADQFREHLVYEPTDYSYAGKTSYNGDVLRANSLARINQARCMGTPCADEYLERFHEAFGQPAHAILLFDLARGIELVYAIERAIEILQDPLDEADTDVAYVPHDGEGYGLVEAPRGPLIHHYLVEEGEIAHAEFIIPTVHNILAIERALHVAAERYVTEQQVDMELERAVGRVVRAFDPCIACATH